jgi:hypothetical protein
MTDMVARVTRPAPYRVRAAAVALAVAGILFVLYPALRPYTDESTLDGARAFTSTAWVASHVMGMIGVLTGIAVALYLPQFFGPPPVRMAHGVLLAIGCLWLAIGLWGSRGAEPRPVYNGHVRNGPRPGIGVPAPRSAPF